MCSITFAQTETDTITTKSGLKYYFTHRGEGTAIDSGKVAIQHYTVWLSNGEKLDSSRDKNEPLASEHPTTGLIKGMNEAISLMKIGDRGIFIMPYQLAYGEKGRGSIPPKETLTFDIELLEMRDSSLQKELMAVLFEDPKAEDTKPNLKAALELFSTLQANNFKDLYLSEGDLNSIGYRLLKKFPNEALSIFKLNVELYPNAGNPHDSLAEAYMTLGDNDNAIKHYEKALELDPENENARNMLRDLKKH
ncbi:hypothetical protein A9Q87_13735 [Flavobacteriales bacterium 34_180_T64]|nr:hypothetical protein A9Q87_13735 [Flavobacteriales bacterium 34_180_T64]